MNVRTWWKQGIPWLRLTGLLLLGVLLWRMDVAALARVLQGGDRSLLAMAVVLNLPMVFLKALRWQTLMRKQGVHYSTGKTYLAYFGSMFVGFLTPGRLGEFVKALHVSQDCGVSTAQAFSSVLVDRLFDLYALLLVGGVALLSLTVAGFEGNALVLIAVMLLLTVPLAVFVNDQAFGRVQALGQRIGCLGRRLFAQDSWLLEMRRGVQQLSPLWLAVGVALTAMAYAVFFGQCYLLALALDLRVGFVQLSFAVALGSLVTLLPISVSGLGTREAAIVAYLGTVGVPAEAALGFSLLVFATFYVAGGLMGAIAWWVKPVPLGNKGVFSREKPW